MTGKACSAEAATGATTGATGATTGKTTGATGAMTGAMTGATGATTGKTVVVAGRDCSGNRELDDQAGQACVPRRTRLASTITRRECTSGRPGPPH